MAQERSGAVTFKGGPLTLVGPEIKVGDAAPDFKVIDGGLAEVTLKSSAGKVRLISVVPSLDTPVCDAQTRKFNEAAANLPGKVAVLTLSLDLPFAQKRFCTTAGIDKLQVLSDHRSKSFGEAYGVLIKELQIHSRAIFVVGADDKVKYVEYVKEVTEHPNYEKALNAAKTAAN
ncbi:MAG: thiol peroxidase [Planctomycetota bacterium]|nr:thiol peroxidase [Planctomycetota bacterium]